MSRSGSAIRLPEWGNGHRAEPDPRFGLAKEGKFLAWTRTELALLAGGIGLDAAHLPQQIRLRLESSPRRVTKGGSHLCAGVLRAVPARGQIPADRGLGDHSAEFPLRSLALREE
jgi:uncharacterized membrane protein YidH (DUF202 family)